MMSEEENTPEEVSETPAAEEQPKVEEQAAVEETPAAEEAAPAEKAPAASGDAPAAEKAEGGEAETEEDGKPKRKTGKDLLAEGTEVVKIRKVKGSKNIPTGIVNIRATFNNTICSICDPSGNVISWSSAGRQGFKGSRKSTAYAATLVGQEAARTAMSHGMKDVDVLVQGPGAGRESAVRAIQSSGLNVHTIRDVTPVPHNGCRARKRRRV
jgi:small subunit ribosomal protein S11